MAGAVMLAVSLSWILLFTLTPAADRPYVDGSTDNSAFAMVFGYNGLERFGISFPGAVASGPGAGASSGAGGYTGPGGPFGLPAGLFKLLSSWYGPQAGWLYPLAGLGLVAGLYLTRWARRGNSVRCGFLMWGMWLCTAGLLFSVMTTIPHTAYLAMLAPPAAALAAVGIYMILLLYRTERRSGWLLPAAVGVEVLWAAILWRGYPGFLPRVLTAALTAGLVAAAVLAVARRAAPRFPRKITNVAVAIGVAAMLAPPAAWSASVLDVNYTGTSFDASAGPPEGHGLFSLFQGPVLGGVFGSSPTLTTQTKAVYDYVDAHRDGARYLLAVPSWTQASRFILASGQEAMPLGGFSGRVRTPALARVRHLVRTGQLRFFWFGWFGGPGTGGADLSSGTVGAIVAWVRGACTQVPAAAYGNPPDDFDNVNGGAKLYECTPAG